MVIFQIYSSGKGEARWAWRLIDNGEEVGVSEKPFTKGEVVTDIKRIKNKINDNTPVISIDNSSDRDSGAGVLWFDYFKEGDDWHWRLNDTEASLAKGVIPDHVFKESNNAADAAESWVKYIREVMQKAEIKWENEEDDPACKDKKGDCTEPKGIPGS